jgi:WD40 repeat protein
MATCGEDKAVMFYEGPPPKFKNSIGQHSHYVSVVKFSPDGSKIASGSNDKTISIIDGKEGEFMFTLVDEDATKNHGKSIIDLKWVNDEQVLTSSNDNTLKLWSVTEKKLLKYVL